MLTRATRTNGYFMVAAMSSMAAHCALSLSSKLSWGVPVSLAKAFVILVAEEAQPLLKVRTSLFVSSALALCFGHVMLKSLQVSSAVMRLLALSSGLAWLLEEGSLS
jgi:hypothetical protein